jgi:hypothetical protein
LSDALLVTTRVSYFRNVTRSGVSALVKEAMAMRSSGHLLQRAGREFLRNLIWCLVGFAPLGAILVAWTDSSLSEVLAPGGTFATVLAALITVPVVWSGGDGEARVGGDSGGWSQPGYYYLDGGGHYGGGGESGGGGAGAGGGGDGGGL